MVTLLLQSASDHYIVRWPPWFGMLLGIAMMGGLYSMALAGIRRKLGNVGLFALTSFVAVLFALAIAQTQKDPIIGTLELWITTLVCILAFVVAPGVVIWAKNRTVVTRFWPQVGWGVLSIYVCFAAAALIYVLVLMINRRIQG